MTMDDPKFKAAVAVAKRFMTETRKSATRDPAAASKALDEIEARLIAAADQRPITFDLVALGLNLWRSFMGLPPSDTFFRRVASANLEEDTARTQVLQLLAARQQQLGAGDAHG